jgi:acylphosphatase
MPKSIHCVVKGRVQGVGYRYFTRNKALELYLTGWVRNLPDETVEVVATGPVLELERLLHYLNEGPIGSRVEKVETQWLPEPREFKDFEIRG